MDGLAIVKMASGCVGLCYRVVWLIGSFFFSFLPHFSLSLRQPKRTFLADGSCDGFLILLSEIPDSKAST